MPALTKEGQPFLALELLDGEDLEQRLARQVRLSVQDALEIGAQILIGLGAAHEAGIVHRDMKPANVFLVSSADGRPFVKVLDFGISKVLDPSKISALTRTGVMLGTPAYMAPEQLQDTRGVDHRADLYATAAILFECMTGGLPYPSSSFGDLVTRVQGGEPRRLDDAISAPPDLADVIARGLSRDRSHRFQNASEMLAALSSFRTRADLPSPPPPVVSHPGALLSHAAHPSPVATPPLGGVGPTGTAALPSQPPRAAPFTPAPAAPIAPAPSFPQWSAAPQYVRPGAMTAPEMTRAQQRGRVSAGVWIGVGFVALALPVACIVGGAIAFGVSEGDDPDGPEIVTPTPTPTTQPPLTAPPVTAPPVTAPPTPYPPTPPNVRPAGDGAPTATPIPAGADPCAVPVEHDVQCDRDWDDFEPATCEVRRGRELHIVGAYAGTTIVVEITRTVAPIVLVLNAYEAVTWELRLADGVVIEEVITSGMNAPTVTGLPSGVRTSHQGRGRWPIMGWSWEGMTENWSGSRLAERAQRHTRLPLRSYVGCYAPTRFLIGQRPP